MKCRACDKILTDFESTRRNTTINDFLDLCSFCLSTVVDAIPTKENWNVFDGQSDDLVSIVGEPIPSKGYGPDDDEFYEDNQPDEN